MPAPNFDLTSKAILVTGSNRGIGRAIALRLGECGASVGVTYSGTNEKSEQAARETCEAIEKTGGQALALSLNVSKEDQVNQAVDTFTKKFGGLYGLVNNAGITADQLLLRHKTEDWDRVMDINVKGAFLMSRACARYLMKAGGSSIVNMSSVSGIMGNPGQAAYSASKAALVGLTKTLAKELGSRQVRVNCIAPGFIETDMTDFLKGDQRAQVIENIPLKTLGSVDDIAWGTLYFLSSLSRYVTGQVLSINGGLYM